MISKKQSPVLWVIVLLGLLVAGGVWFWSRQYRPNTQFVSGKDLDVQNGRQNYVPSAIFDHWPLKAGDSVTSAANGSFTITAKTDCGSASKYFDFCKFTLNPKKKICQAKNPVEKIDLLVIRGTYVDDGATVTISNGGTNGAIVACDTTYPEGDYTDGVTKPASWDWVGAMAKCIYWSKKGFSPSVAKDDRYISCIRAVRSDYCGDGDFSRPTNTFVDLYDRRYAADPNLVEPDPVDDDNHWPIEAVWKTTQATCVSNDIYNHKIKNAQCKDKFRNASDSLHCIDNETKDTGVLITTIPP